MAMYAETWRTAAVRDRSVLVLLYMVVVVVDVDLPKREKLQNSTAALLFSSSPVQFRMRLASPRLACFYCFFFPPAMCPMEVVRYTLQYSTVRYVSVDTNSPHLIPSPAHMCTPTRAPISSGDLMLASHGSQRSTSYTSQDPTRTN
jgi:hypothetical protein